MRMNIYYSLLMILLSVASIGCSDNNVEWESDEVPSDKITLDMQGTLDLLHNESAVVKIVTGTALIKSIRRIRTLPRRKLWVRMK